MIPMSLKAIAEVVDGRVHGVSDAEAESIIVDGPVVTDSREAGPGGLYVARVGAALDGHDFVLSARDLGAVAALTSRVVDSRCIVVDDVQEAFVRLSQTVIAAVDGLLVVGITGSSGKTSTKDVLAQVLAARGETVAPVGSLNSEVGVPLTVCRVTPTTANLVVEMGARGIGHIAYLTRIAPPRIGVVLNVGVAHVGEFGSVDAIALAKGELVEALPADGLAVLNIDDPRVWAMRTRTAARVVGVGEAPEADVRAVDVTVDDEGRPSFVLQTRRGARPVRLGLVGRHHVANALAVAAVALEAGLPVDTVAERLSAAAAVSRWRMEVTTRPDGVIVVNDAYNANPESMRAALRAVHDRRVAGRRIAVLGPMLELGEHTQSGHEEVGAAAVDHAVDHLIVVGSLAAPMADGARSRAAERGIPIDVRQVPDSDSAYEMLTNLVAPGDVVLFKSSRDGGLRFLGDRVAQFDEGESVTMSRPGDVT